MARLWARTVTFQSVNVGDQLPILVKWETKETIQAFNALVSPTASADEELVLDPAALLSYVTELLEKAFPLSSIMAEGSKLDMDSMALVRPEDTISLTGQVIAKCLDSDQRLVECEITIENQEGVKVGRAVAIVAL